MRLSRRVQRDRSARARGLGAVAVIAVVAVVVMLGASGCSRPVQTARTSPGQPLYAAEESAALRWQTRHCSPSLGLLAPGAAQMCLRKPGEGAVLLALTAGEVGAAIAASGEAPADDPLSYPGVYIPLIALQDVWIYGQADASIDRALASRSLYAPQDSLADLAAAPFNLEVMRRPSVWGGALVMLALGIGASMLIDGAPDTDAAGGDPNLFGRTVDRGIGYPVAFGIGAGVFSHVAVAEEALFRGVLQSSLARRLGERDGWLWGSAIFGAAHAFNALLLPSEDRTPYLVYAVPFITGVGSYLGYLYRDSGYSLAPPVAVHFWYDFVLSAVFFTLDPENSPLSAGITIPF